MAIAETNRGHDTTLDPIRKRRLDMLLRQTALTGAFSILFAIMLTVLLRDTGQLEAMRYWVGINILMVLTRETLIYPRFRAMRRRGEARFELIHGTIVFFWFFAGMIWGVGGYLFMPGGDQPELVITFVTTFVGLTAGNIVTFAPSIWTGVVFTVPAILGLALRVYEYGYIVFFYCMLIYILFLIISIIRISRSVIKGISVDLDNEGLLREVTREKERAELEKDRAEKANLSKSEFLAAASHDLRQPLNSIGLFLYGLKQKLLSEGEDEGKLQLVEKIESAHHALSEMFSGLLEISNLDTGKIQARPAPIRPGAVVQSVIDELGESAAAKGLEVRYRGADSWTISDGMLLSRILRNLLGNAIKYTKEGRIEISERVEEDWVVIEIADTGIGISEQDLNHIFDEYYQVGNKRRDRREGVGLGLFISKRLCELLGYQIHARSELGKGSRFTITLPLARNTQRPDRQGRREALPSLEDLRVLVIDDDPEILTGMRLILEPWRCRVDTARDGEQASQAIAAASPDVILCDYRLQDDLTGIELLRALEQQLGKAIPAIIISGEHVDPIKDELRDTGHPLLTKPIQPVKLHAAISGLSARMPSK